MCSVSRDHLESECHPDTGIVLGDADQGRHATTALTHLTDGTKPISGDVAME